MKRRNLGARASSALRIAKLGLALRAATSAFCVASAAFAIAPRRAANPVPRPGIPKTSDPKALSAVSSPSRTSSASALDSPDALTSAVESVPGIWSRRATACSSRTSDALVIAPRRDSASSLASVKGLGFLLTVRSVPVTRTPDARRLTRRTERLSFEIVVSGSMSRASTAARSAGSSLKRALTTMSSGCGGRCLLKDRGSSGAVPSELSHRRPSRTELFPDSFGPINAIVGPSTLHLVERSRR